MPSMFKHVKKLFLVIILILIAIVAVNYRDQLLKIAKPIGGVAEDIYSAFQVDEKKDEVTNALDEYLGIAKDGAIRTVVVHGDEQTYQIDAELAMSDESRSRGLMYRESLCDDCGMLFIFDKNHDSGFWMKNCKIPLDIIFIDAGGAIVDIKEDFQPCTEDPCPSYTPIREYRNVLEVNGSWCEEHEIRVGDSVEIPSLD